MSKGVAKTFAVLDPLTYGAAKAEDKYVGGSKKLTGISSSSATNPFAVEDMRRETREQKVPEVAPPAEQAAGTKTEAGIATRRGTAKTKKLVRTPLGGGTTLT